MMKRLSFLILCCFYITSCENPNSTEPVNTPSGRHQKMRLRFGNPAAHGNGRIRSEKEKEVRPDTFVLADYPTATPYIQWLTVEEIPHNSLLSTTGTVKANPGKIAEIASPFEGRITKSYVQVGQTLKAGSPVFQLHSPEYLETGRSFINAKNVKATAERQWLRQKDLLEHGVGVKKEVEASELEYENARIDYFNAAAALKVFGVDTTAFSVGDPLIVRTPVSGVVLSNQIVVGQYLKPDAPPVAVVADLSKVWVVARIKEIQLSKFNRESVVEITSDAYPKKVFRGEIEYISDILDEETRSLQVIITCNNPGILLKQGLFVSVNFIDKNDKALVIPPDALIQDADESCVLVKLDDARVVKRRIKVYTDVNGIIEVEEGLRPGETIMSEGNIYFTKK